MNDLSHTAGEPLRWAARIARFVRAAVFLIAAGHLVLLYGPWIFDYGDLSLESSWRQVVTFATASGWQWGREIAWTYGPLGFAWWPVYFEPLLAAVFIVRTVFVVALVLGVIGILRYTPPLLALAVYALVLFASSALGPNLYVMIPLFATLIYFRAPGDAKLRWIGPLVVASGVLALTYSPSGVLSLALFALMDASRLLRRRAPVFVPLFAAAMLVGYLLASQSLSSLPDYLRSLFELISGYPDAMSAQGKALEIVAFLALAVASAALVVRSELPALRDPRRRGDSGLLLACLAVFGFIMFKTGFVRHDPFHSIWSWAALGIGLAGYVGIRPPGPSGWALAVPMLGIAAIACCVEAMLFHGGDRVSFVGERIEMTFFRVPVASFKEARTLFFDTKTWRQAKGSSRDLARAAAAATHSELRVATTVDMVGNSQGALLLQDVDLRTRPVFQDFAAYTPWLMEINRAHLRSPRAAETVLLSTETIDNRYPMMDRGMAVVELLSHYQPERVAAGYLVLRRRPVPLELTSATVHEQDAVLDQWVDVPVSDSPVILNADIRPNALGRVARLLFRLPHAILSVRLSDGSEHAHRIVPAYGREGMLLSPYVDGVVGYLAMATGVPASSSGNRVVAFKIRIAGPCGAACFDDDFRLRLSAVRMPGADAEAVDTELRLGLDRRRTAYEMANSAASRNPLLSARDTLLLAHPPVTASLQVPSAHQLQVTYALSDGAWKDGGATDGVCFHIRFAGADGERVKLHERCLRPVERTEDRGEHRVVLPLSLDKPGSLVFETDCGGNCSWDWSYWKDIDVTP